MVPSRLRWPRDEDQPPRAPRLGRVLIVDDSQDMRELYATYLGHSGFTTLTAVDGRAALDSVLGLKPDVIVMDLAMPNLDGVTAIRLLKQDQRTRDTPVILLTGYPGRAIEQGALEAGADVFLTKPCLPEDLEGHIRRLIDR